MADDFEYISHARLEYREGYRYAYLGEVPEPVVYGVQGALLLVYAGVVWLLCHGFVLLYEEPTLRREFGPSYDAYRASVRRWWPRIRPWRGPSRD